MLGIMYISEHLCGFLPALVMQRKANGIQSFTVIPMSCKGSVPHGYLVLGDIAHWLAGLWVFWKDCQNFTSKKSANLLVDTLHAELHWRVKRLLILCCHSVITKSALIKLLVSPGTAKFGGGAAVCSAAGKAGSGAGQDGC